MAERTRWLAFLSFFAFFAFFALVLGAGPAVAASPWLPEEGRLEFSTVTVYETFDEFRMGGKKTDFGMDFEQITQAFSLQYGLFEDVALDFTTGYVRVFGDLPTNDGLMDTTLGVQLRLVDEFEWDAAWVPTVTARFGGIIAGTYDANGAVFPGIPGEKASGLESEISVGKNLPYGFALAGALGMRVREKDVPLEWHLRTAAYYTPFEIVTLSFAYDQWRATSGIDIGDPNSASEFRNIREVTQNIEAGLTLSDPGQHVFVTGYYTHTVDGRNTGLKDVGGVSITVPIQIFER